MSLDVLNSPAIFAGHGLAARRGDRALFAGLSFALGHGDALVLRGPNGSGKSTLLRLLAGFGRPEAGKITWQGGNIDQAPELHRARLHYLGHHDALKPALTVMETLDFWHRLAGQAGDVEPALEAFGIGHLAELPCRFLSSGQRRRLALTRLVTWQAPLWLLDEPTVGLDTEALGLLEEAIAAQRRAGGIVVLATHQDLAMAGAEMLEIDRFPPLPLDATADLAW